MEKERYNHLNKYLKEKFGERTLKICIDGGFTCPNRDGTLSSKGCLYCSEGGSGDFASNFNTSITTQLNEAKAKIQNKTNCKKFIAYFQAYTNTYASVDYLKKIFYEAINSPDIAALSIARSRF